jgi:hypothetical protein
MSKNLQGSQHYVLSNSASVQLGAGFALFKERGSMSMPYGTPVVGASALRIACYQMQRLKRRVKL